MIEQEHIANMLNGMMAEMAEQKRMLENMGATVERLQFSNEDRLVTLQDVMAITGRKQSAVYGYAKQSWFPEPVMLGDGDICRQYWLSEVMEALNKRKKINPNG